MSMRDAIQDVADDLVAGVEINTALANAAEEYGLKTPAIQMRFEEQHGPIEAYAAKARDQKANRAAISGGPVKDAVAEAQRWRAEAFVGGSGQSVGKLFEFKGEQYAYVAFVNGKMGLKAVRVQGCRRVGITTDIRKVLAQLGETASAELAAKKRKRRAVLPKETDDPCWDGYTQRGTKIKDGREVPNCVPRETAADRTRLGYLAYLGLNA